MNGIREAPLALAEERFSRFAQIQWWDQAKLREGRVLLVGAGALGNEVLKNLALLGIGSVVVADMDRIEKSNLCRSVLFREADESAPKAECAARSARDLYPQMEIRPLVGNVLAQVGLGYFRWAQIVVGALDNREARVFLNSACARTGRTWIDGGIEVLHGIVRGFAPPKTACYECTMGRADWEQLNRRRSCSLLARRAHQQQGVATTPTTASVIGALQAVEVVKFLHGLKVLLGSGYFFDGSGYDSYRIDYPIHPDCPWHEAPAAIESLEDCTSETPLEMLWARAERLLGGVSALDLGRDLVVALVCGTCGRRREVYLPAERVTEEQARCEKCGTECAAEYLQSVAAGDPILKRTIRQAGLPSWDVVWARFGGKCVGLEIAGDNPFRRTSRSEEA